MTRRAAGFVLGTRHRAKRRTLRAGDRTAVGKAAGTPLALDAHLDPPLRLQLKNVVKASARAPVDRATEKSSGIALRRRS